MPDLRKHLAVGVRKDLSGSLRTVREKLLIRRFRVRFPGDPPLTRSFALASMIVRFSLTRKRRATCRENLHHRRTAIIPSRVWAAQRSPSCENSRPRSANEREVRCHESN
jgi:hypothetical protein